MSVLLRIWLVLIVALLAIVTKADPYLEQEILPLETVLIIYPEAQRLVPLTRLPKAYRVMAADKALGYVFYSDQILPINAYSGKPIRVLIALENGGVIKALAVTRHSEPILAAGISEENFESFLNQYVGVTVNSKIKLGRQVRSGYTNIDGLSGATITSMVLHRSIINASRSVFKAGSSLDTADVREGDSIPLWQVRWQQSMVEIVILLVMLSVLTSILFFQDWLVVHVRLFTVFRIGFLVLTTFYLGFYLRAQLSIINIMTFGQMLTKGFAWDGFMIDPFIFLLWAFVAFSLLLWGRGVYCGWLCPFGALQELTNKLALVLKIPQFRLPLLVHERLLALKYIILMLLVGLSLDSIATVIPYLDIEPFKTLFSLRLNHSWPLVSYSLILIAVSCFNAKLYCKYICPLGAALSVGTHFRIFNWLRRRTECGSPCGTCSKECPVGAITETGEIIANECHYCLECQASYWNDHKCPPMVKKRERRERYLKRGSKSPDSNNIQLKSVD